MRSRPSVLLKDGSDHLAYKFHQSRSFSDHPHLNLEQHMPTSMAQGDLQGGHQVAVKSTKHALEAGRPLMIESNSAGRTHEGKIELVCQLCGSGRNVAVEGVMKKD